MSIASLTDHSRSSVEGLVQALAPLAGRILLAAIFVISGLGKLADPSGAIGYIASIGAPFPEAAYALAVVVEVAGGLALIAGWRTRAVAVALALFTIATAVMFHAALSDQSQFIHFLKNLAIAGGLLQVAAFGAGRMALDARRS